MPNGLVTIPTEIQIHIESIPTVCQTALSIEVNSDDAERTAGEASRRLNTELKRLTEHRLSITRPLDEAKKGVVDLFAIPLKALETAGRTVDQKILAYRDNQRIIREEQERAWREKAERDRAEAERKAEELNEKARAEAEKGNEGRAEYLRNLADSQDEKAQNIVAPVAPPLQRVEGVGERQNWSAEVVDLLALVKAVAEGTAPLECILPNQTALNGLARALKDGMRYPGVIARNNPTLSKRGF